MHNNIMAAGSKDRPPMLGPGRYSQWRSRFLRYIDTKPNGEGLRKSILSGPYVPSIVLSSPVASTEQYQNEVNDIRAERIAKSANPLALLAAAQPYSDNYYQAPKPQRTNTTSSSTRPSASTRHKGKEIAKPVTPQSESVSEEDSDPEQAQRDKDMQKNLALLAKYFKKLYKPTNNNLQTSSNSRNKTKDTTPRYNNDNQSGQFENQRTMTVDGARETADFSNIYDLLLEECVSKDVTCSYLHSLSDLNAYAELQCLYLHKVKECECLAQKLSKQTESVNKEVHNKLLKSFAKLENHSISLELALQQSQMQDKHSHQYLNDVNARTKKPKVVPISTSKPKRKTNKSVATPYKKIVASDTTIQKSKSYYKELYENTNQEWKWWIAKTCPSGYTWTQKPPRTKKKWIPKIRKDDVSTNCTTPSYSLVNSGCHKAHDGQSPVGTKFLNKTLHAYFKEEGMNIRPTTPRTPKLTAFSERWNRTLVEAARTILLASKLPLG
ncbi:integrase, catalytic region, zinc finger, CCHC-type containing protein [Tanacetum coccineum]